MSLTSIKDIILKFSLPSGDDQFGGWGKFAEPDEVIDFIDQLND